MYVCMYVCMYVRVYVHVYARETTMLCRILYCTVLCENASALMTLGVGEAHIHCIIHTCTNTDIPEIKRSKNKGPSESR